MSFHIEVVASGQLSLREESEVLALHSRAFPPENSLSLADLQRSSIDPHVLVVARQTSDNTIIGMGCFAPYYKDTDWSYLWNLAVESQYRRIGIGKSLVMERIKLARRLGKTLVLAKVRLENETYFRKLGFSDGDEQVMARLRSLPPISGSAKPLFLKL